VSTLTGILDAEMVIGLAKGGVFHLLASVYARLYIPTGVRQEVVTGQGLPGEAELLQALGVWITEVTPDPQAVQQLPATLSMADREVVAAAQAHQHIDHVLTGDRRLYRLATDLGFTCLGTTEVVVLLKDCGLAAEVKPVLDRMRQRGYGIDDVRYEEALRAAGECAISLTPG
jgi:predicted nucleic acid-binding protein